MSATSARIVGLNNRIAALSKNILDNLVEMDVNEKKFRLLKKELYFEGFEAARRAYERDLNRILGLVSREGQASGPWQHISSTYQPFTRFHAKTALMDDAGQWTDDGLVSRWIDQISQARQANEAEIEQALIRINTQSRQIVKNGIIGFGISILAGLAGIIFISRSMISPLNKLKAGLKQVSRDNYSHQIHIASNDEFEELAGAFNDMSRQLKADEDIRSDFIASLSHEIRTPLSSIRESVNMIVEEVLGPVNKKQKKFLKIASREITRITSLLNHLLDTSVLGAEPRQPAPIDPDALVKEAVHALGPAAELRGVALSYAPADFMTQSRQDPMSKDGALPGPPLRILGEKKEIIRVLLNLIGNALKFAPEHGRVAVALGPDRDDGFLAFTVSDDGPGIPPEKQGLIFKKYYRAEETRKNLDGVGLGLNIARHIIRDHGGRISVKNNPDKGCTFTFTLPVYKGNTQ
ncbi:MAG: HAMP domain-containing histidine kinase [Desulfobacter sp.]|nr:MAG: HAMP domain-containing histidine kinase [Desulfobacter sp.]